MHIEICVAEMLGFFATSRTIGAGPQGAIFSYRYIHISIYVSMYLCKIVYTYIYIYIARSTHVS